MLPESQLLDLDRTSSVCFGCHASVWCLYDLSAPNPSDIAILKVDRNFVTVCA